MKYKVEITETLQRIVEVEAETAQEAEKKVIEDYEDTKIMLDYDDFKGVSFDVKE